MFHDLKTAIVVDALPVIGGAEKVLLTVLELFPSADIFTHYYNKEIFTGTQIGRLLVTTSFIDSLPGVRRYYRYSLPLMPYALKDFHLRSYDLVISFTYAVAHGVRLDAGQMHLSYVYTPMRYAWRNIRLDGSRAESPGIFQALLSPFRRWDRASASRVGYFAAVSSWIARWVQRAYGRYAEVIYPPVDIDRFTPAPQRDNYFIALSRLVPHKRIDLLVDAFNRLKLPLLVVGDGPERKRLSKRAGPNICFLGYQPDDILSELLSRARGFVCVAEEDFGTAIVEAQAAGCPVIAYASGGASEIVLHQQTGLLFRSQDTGSLLEGIEELNQNYQCFNPLECSANARRFSKQLFLENFSAFVSRCIAREDAIKQWILAEAIES